MTSKSTQMLSDRIEFQPCGLAPKLHSFFFFLNANAILFLLSVSSYYILMKKTQ